MAHLLYHFPLKEKDISLRFSVLFPNRGAFYTAFPCIDGYETGRPILDQATYSAYALLMKSIGVLGGLGPDTTAEFYKMVIRRSRQRFTEASPLPLVDSLESLAKAVVRDMG